MSTFMDTVDQRPSNPIANVIVNGLALLCFSKRNSGRAEVGCLAVPRHDLFFTIYNPYCSGIYQYPDGSLAHHLINGKNIVINSDKSGIGSLFYPDDLTNPTSFRHMVNIDRIHEQFGKGRVRIEKNQTYFGEVYITEGVFYTEKLSTQKAIIHLPGNEQQMLFEPHKVGKIFGADVGNSPGDQELEIKIKLKDETIRKIELPRAAKPYTIMIRHKCNERDVDHRHTDFQRYYEILKFTQPKHKKTDLTWEHDEDPYAHDCETALKERFKKDTTFQKEVERNKELAMLFESFRRATEACEVGGKYDCADNLRGIDETCP